MTARGRHAVRFPALSAGDPGVEASYTVTVTAAPR